LPTTDDGPTAVTVADGMAAYNTESRSVEVVNTASGERICSRWLGDLLLALPALSDGRLFSAWPHAGQHRFGAFAPRDGRPLWETLRTISSPRLSFAAAPYTSVPATALSPASMRRTGSGWRREMNATRAPWVVGDAVAQRTVGVG
jgi:hypothetical protein